ncbi:hypothetical protein [Actinacidiphila paucisporea]|uniref:Helix-turn-helix domain-containing protein n=1 Tax=Actinacidiphila paucisporea TaxID=310782 RepID=A0A1M7QWV2_9ACTN|nr:hypothetical protein [Actinacidiphila paucisporea]SHN36493.1 hypothetical protein SAMN05216499_14711 [Actinacidiphila paucisporea]
MQIHRSRHARGFTVLPNTLLQDRRLSYTARGLLADLLSRPDGWREDGRHMADTSPQGRLTVAKALRELTAAGYYRVERVRRPDGTFVSESHVYDSPQLGPGLTRPGSGEAAADDRGAHPVKDRGKEPTLPAQRSRPADAGSAVGEGGRGKPPTIQPDGTGTTGPADAAVGEAVSTLFRVLRPEPRLRLGTVEAMALAPLVTPWLERGYGQRDLAAALLGGLPARVHSAPAILRDRLTRKLPPASEPAVPATPRWSECGTCARPVPHSGVCRSCAGLAREPGQSEDMAARASVAARGRASVRAALNTGPGRLLPARA